MRLDPALILEQLQEAKRKAQEDRAAAKREAELAKLSPEERSAHEKRSRRTANARAQREEERQRRHDDWLAEHDRRKRSALEASRFVAERLGNDLGDLIELMADPPWHEFGSALQQLVSCSNKTADAEEPGSKRPELGRAIEIPTLRCELYSSTAVIPNVVP